MSFLKLQLKRIGAELVGALVDAGFEKATELASSARERRERPPPVDSDAEERPKGRSDPLQKVGMPSGTHLSRDKCPGCDGALFYCRNSEGDGGSVHSISYWCPRPGCQVAYDCGARDASNREGVPL